MSDFGWLSGLGGIAGAIGGWINNNNNIDAAWAMMQAQQAFNAKQAEIQRDWTEDMRATQYQTTMEDMKKGGLNPILAGQVGGAGVPGSASAAVSPGGMPPQQQNFLAQGIASGVELLRTLTQAQLTQAAVEKTQAETAKTEAETTVVPTVAELNAALTALHKGNTLTPEQRELVNQLENEVRRAQAAAGYGSAGASAASAEQSLSATELNRFRLGYQKKWGADIAPAQGTWGTPPPSQIGGTASVLGGLIPRIDIRPGTSARTIDQQTGDRGAHKGFLSESLGNLTDQVIKGLGITIQRRRETQGH